MTRSPRQRRRAQQQAEIERRARLASAELGVELADVDPLWTRSLRVVLLGRTKRRLDGGLARSVRMIQADLGSLGNSVVLQSCNEPLAEEHLDGADLVWHYGDEQHLEQQRRVCAKRGVPLLVNSLFDGTVDREVSIERRAEGTDDYFVVFTEGARDRLSAVPRHRLVVLPKTVRSLEADGEELYLGSRRGICIGELAKLRRERLVHGIDVCEVVQAIRRVLPTEPILTYGQYTTKEHLPFEHTQNIPKPGDGMSEFIRSLRLCICLTAWETYSMVPAEAQSVGVPVIYRRMPQSLSEHIGITGVAANSAEEVAMAAYRLLSSPVTWRHYANAGLLNHASRARPAAALAMDMELRRLLMRRRKGCT